ncbi:MAG: Rne/Rng family ribonuclease, partial [Armatimonadota bacterium]
MVSKEIIVNGDPRETRIAVREDGKLVELHIERGERVVGSIFKGRVDNVVAGQDAAFVDIGLERNAYLAAGDIVSPGELDEDDSFDRRGRRP